MSAAISKRPDKRGSTPEERSAYFSRLGKKSHDRRVTLTLDDEEREALVAAYCLIRKVADRAKVVLPDDEEAPMPD